MLGAVIVVNALANILPINGSTTGQVSARYDNFFTPAGFAFSIWALIYLSLIAWVVKEFFTSNPTKIDGRSFQDALGYGFVLNGVANIGWIFAWHYGFFGLTMLCILIILGTLAWINLRIISFSWFMKFPFQLYFGWICVATIANFAVYFKYLGWSASAPLEEQWGIGMVAVATILAVCLAIKRHFLVSSMTIGWGIFGIYMKQIDTTYDSKVYEVVCLIAINVILLVSIYNVVRQTLMKRTLLD